MKIKQIFSILLWTIACFSSITAHNNRQNHSRQWGNQTGQSMPANHNSNQFPRSGRSSNQGFPQSTDNTPQNPKKRSKKMYIFLILGILALLIIGGVIARRRKE